MSDSEKACTESMTPDRVRNVPRIVSANVAQQQRDVPDPQHPAALLHHHRVQVGGAGEPRQQRRVLDRVPRPVAAPAEHLVGPPGAEHDADGQEAPGEQGPAAGGEQPPLAHPAGDQRGDGEGERDGEADVAEVEHRRVERHQDVVLQQRVRSGPVERAPGSTVVNGLAGPSMRPKKKMPTTSSVSSAQPTSGSVRRARNLWAMTRGVAGQHQGPQQDRPLERGPHGGDVEQRRRAGRAVVGHELEGEVAGDQRPFHRDGGEDGAGEGEERVGASCADERGALARAAPRPW